MHLGNWGSVTNGKIDTVNYCATNPLDPSCGNSQSSPNAAIFASWGDGAQYHAQGYTATTSGSTPGQQVVTTTPTATGNIFSSVASSSWYKTWWGLGLLGIGAFFGYKYFIAPKKRS